MEPRIEPPDQGTWCKVCDQPVAKRWTGEKYVTACACENDYYEED